MIEVFMSICLLTTLNCDDVHVGYIPMSYNTEAMAVIDENGHYGVFLSEHKKYRGADKKYLMVHEIAHLLVFEIDSTNTTHDEQFMKICMELADLANLQKPKVACAPRSECLEVLCR